MNRKFSDKVRTVFEFRRAVQFVWDTAPGLTSAALILSLLQGVVPFVSLYAFKLLIDTITHKPSYASVAEYTFRIIELLLITAGTAIMSTIISSVSTVIGDKQSQLVSDKILYTLHTQSAELDLAYYEDSKYQDTLHRAQIEAPIRCAHVVNNFSQLLLSFITLLSILVLLLVTIHWQLVLLLAVLAIPGVAVKILFAEKMYGLSRRNTQKERESNYFSWLLTSDISAKEIRIFDLGRYFRERASMLRRSLRAERAPLIRDRAQAETSVEILTTAATYLVFATVAIAAANGTTTIGSLAVFFQAFQRGQAALKDLMGALSDTYENNLFLSNLYEFLDLKATIRDPVTPCNFPKQIELGLSVHNVSFSYPNSVRPALLNVSLSLRPGETLALVGENGSGKSTLIKLLCRLYDPSTGDISVDGIPLNQFSLSDLRNNISVLFQDFHRYNLSVQENIAIGQDESVLDQARLINAALESGADAMIETLQSAYKTELGYLFAGGEELSIGQWQKIALARAFYRNSQILLLDEPTSALDAESEQYVLQTFQKLAKGRIAIIVSHKLSAVRQADRIVVLADGGIAEQGTHDELITLNGIYAHSFRTQANNYKEQHEQID